MQGDLAGERGEGAAVIDWEVGNSSGQLGVCVNLGARLKETRVNLDANEGDSSSLSSTTVTDGAPNLNATQAHVVGIGVPQARDLDADRAARNLWQGRRGDSTARGSSRPGFSRFPSSSREQPAWRD